MPVCGSDIDRIAESFRIQFNLDSAIDGDGQRCIAAGMDDYLSKPFTAAEFSAVIDRQTVN